MRTPCHTLAALLASSFLFLTVAPAFAGGAEFSIKLATVAPDNTPWSELLKRYKKRVETKAGKERIEVKLFLGGMLGDENETVTKCKRGQIQAVGASTGAMATAVPELNVVELPFLFRNASEADAVIDEVITPALDPTFRKYGLVLGFWSENGFRHFGTKDKFVKSPDDLKGRKMRSQESKVHTDMYEALGASPVPIPTTEALTALQTGTVDGFDQATLFTIAANWHKTVKFFTISNHIYQPAIIAFNKEWFDKLPADLQTILIEEGRLLQGKGRGFIRDILPGLNDILVKDGLQVHQLTDAERVKFEAATKSVRKKLGDRQGADTQALIKTVEAKLSALRGGK